MSYRESHLQKGESYDQDIATDPFDGYIAKRQHESLRRLIRSMYPAGIDRALDFACGTGRITEVLEESAREIVGLDISPSMLAKARHRCKKTTFVEGDITSPEFSSSPHFDRPFDLITSFRFFGNAEPELRLSVLERLARLLSPNGRLIINNHRNPWAIRPLLRERLAGARFEPRLEYPFLRDALARNGLRIESLEGIGWWMFRAKLLNPSVLESRFIRGLERLGRSIPFTGYISPDSVIVIRPAA